MKTHSLLGNITPAEFLKKFWQKRPLLIRNALPDGYAPLNREALFALAAREEVESRLITHFAQSWKLAHGPFAQLPSVKKKAWSLLVQGVNLHDDQADQLLQQFRFIPDARLDDLMISYASDAGGVGPHFDSYDVFLLQAHGQRRWRISAQKDLTLKSGMPLKILDNFQPTEEFILNPGDMLYLPPHYAHEGVAIGECITCSIGFRAPDWQSLGESFLNFMADSVELPGRYSDPDLQPTRLPARIDDGMLDQVMKAFTQLASTPADVAIFLGEYLSEPKPSTVFERPTRPLSLARFQAKVEKNGLKLPRKTRMLYRGKLVFINGESAQANGPDRKILEQLANHRMLAPDSLGLATSDLLESLYNWYCDGWLITSA
jgi:50S ribosomal protein L16 3-hydroxylase